MKLIKGSQVIYTVYEIRNKENNRVYIGSTVDLEKRWSSHRAALKGGYHSNKELQKDYDKFGINSFEFKKILTLTDKFWEGMYTMQYYGTGLLYNHRSINRYLVSTHKKKEVVDLDMCKKYKSISNAAKQTGCNSGNISKCCNHKYKSTVDKKGIKHRFEYFDYVLKHVELLSEITDQEYLIYRLNNYSIKIYR